MALTCLLEGDMPPAPPRALRRQYPVLYWITLIYLVGIPNFVHFDPTGRTRNPINVSSISVVILGALTTYVFIIMVLLDRRPLICRKVNVPSLPWLALLLIFMVTTVMQPVSRLTPPSKMDLPLSLFWLEEWSLAFILSMALYARASPQHATEEFVHLIGAACWTKIALVWVFLPMIPQQVFGVAEDESAAVRQLGGELINPGALAIIAGIGFFYSLFFFTRGPWKWACCLTAFATLVLTVSRTGQASFLLAVLLYAVVFSKRPAIRWGTIGVLLIAGVTAMGAHNALLKYVLRGQTVQSLESLNDRTRVWNAAVEAVSLRPLLGYGYSVGARHALRDHWTYSHWIPPHAHDEVLQAALDGGVFAAAVTLGLGVVVLYWGFRQAKRGRCYLFLLMAVLQLEVEGATGGLMMVNFGTLGFVFILCYISLSGDLRETANKAIKLPPAERRLPPGEIEFA
jgi:O-antigen ligase